MKVIKNTSGPVLSEYLARSPGGLWVRSVRTDTDIEIFWKPRFQYENSIVTVLDFNGDITKKIVASEVEWGEEWVLAGKIELVDEMAVMSGLEHFEQFIVSLARHAVHLLTSGYGEDPEEVIGWFSDFGERNFIVEDAYNMIGSHGEFSGLEGATAKVKRSDSGSISATVIVKNAEFEVDLDNSELFTSFVIATCPA